MEFKVGEKVRFLHEKMEGIVQEILGDTKVLVLVDDLLEEEVPVSELVKIHRSERNLRSNEQEKEIPEFLSKVARKLPLALAITRNRLGVYELWLLNPTPLELMFNVFVRIRKKTEPLNSGRAEGRSEMFIGKLSSDQFHHCKSLLFQILKYSGHPDFNPRDPLVVEITLRSEIFNEKPIFIESLGREGYFLPLEKAEDDTIAEPAKVKKVEQPAGPPSEVIDLHIQKLVKSFDGLDGNAMLAIQIEAFQQALNQAVLHNMSRIIFIHGVGSGRLKEDIETILESHQFVFNFQKADPIKFGNGATEVELA